MQVVIRNLLQILAGNLAIGLRRGPAKKIHLSINKSVGTAECVHRTNLKTSANHFDKFGCRRREPADSGVFKLNDGPIMSRMACASSFASPRSASQSHVTCSFLTGIRGIRGVSFSIRFICEFTFSIVCLDSLITFSASSIAWLSFCIIGTHTINNQTTRSINRAINTTVFALLAFI
jgi:hypothetical protein